MLIRSMLNAPQNVSREMDRLFDTMLASSPLGFGPGRQNRLVPSLNVWEDEANLFVEAELPGVSMNDLEVLVSDGELTIKGERRVETPDENMLRRERITGSFERTMSLPFPVDHEHIEAELDHGVLTVRLPKAPAAMPRRIDVRSKA